MVFKAKGLSSSIVLFLLINLLGLTVMNSALASKVDPTGPFGHRGNTVTKHDKTTFKLESIIHGVGIHTAVINGKLMQPFDIIGEYKLTAINDKSVILRSKNKRLKLHIFKEGVVKINTVKQGVKNNDNN